jgi:hypothetical protein
MIKLVDYFRRTALPNLDFGFWLPGFWISSGSTASPTLL